MSFELRFGQIKGEVADECGVGGVCGERDIFPRWDGASIGWIEKRSGGGRRGVRETDDERRESRLFLGIVSCRRRCGEQLWRAMRVGMRRGHWRETYVRWAGNPSRLPMIPGL